MLFNYNNQRFEAIHHPNGTVYIYRWNGKTDKMNIDFMPEELAKKITEHYQLQVKREVL